MIAVGIFGVAVGIALIGWALWPRADADFIDLLLGGAIFVAGVVVIYASTL